MIGEGCDRPEETCLTFGGAAEYYIRNGLGRAIDRQEALEILQGANKAGLVLQPSNTKRATFICSCCGCCCGILRNLKRYPRPADLVVSAFSAAANPDVCKGCGACVKRCQMDALRLEEGVVVLDEGRCIGCGLCVTTCPTGALSLVPKPERRPLPKDAARTSIRLGRERGAFKMTDLAMMLVRSKVDRLRAALSKDDL
jgi:ferredoxin